MHGSQARTSEGWKPLGKGRAGAGAKGSDRMHMHPTEQNYLFLLSAPLSFTLSRLRTGYFLPPGQNFHSSFV